MRRTLPWLAVIGLAACDTGSQLVEPASPSFQMDALTEASAVIPGHFIVTVREGVDPDVVAGSHGVTPSFVYRNALNGFAGAIPDGAVEALRQDTRVELVEADMVAYAAGTQPNAPWGLDRIDQRALPLNTTYSYNQTGAGVVAYIVDSGIRVTHADFGGRASAPYQNQGAGFDAMTDGQKGGDCNGHGTHVAGTVGGRTYGVAKDVRLVSIRVLGCDGTGTASGIVAGLDYIWAQKHANPSQPMLANMSIGFPLRNSTADAAVQKIINKGVATFVAAGNGVANRGVPQDACMISPAAVPDAITIGNANRFDEKSTSSNFGDCVDFFAPGSSIMSAWHTGDNATNTISGTSMAAPHAAGVGALYLQQFPSATPRQVRDVLFNATSKGAVQLSLTANNHLLYSFVGALSSYNRAPVGNAGGPYTGVEGAAVAFNASGSSDPDGDALTYHWTFGDGSTAAGARPSHAFADNGTYNVTLTVADPHGARSTTTTQVVVSNAAPVVDAGTNATLTSGQALNFRGTFRDAGANDSPWSYTLHWGNGSPSLNGTVATQEGPIGGSGRYLRAGSYTVTLEVADKDGGQGTASATVTVVRAPVSLDVRPGTSDNTIHWNESNSAKVPVAILGTAELNVREVQAATVRIGDVRVAARKNGTSMFSFTDANGDGLEDLVLHFELQALIDNGALTRETTVLELIADLASGVQVRGTDAVRVQ